MDSLNEISHDEGARNDIDEQSESSNISNDTDNRLLTIHGPITIACENVATECSTPMDMTPNDFSFNTDPHCSTPTGSTPSEGKNGEFIRARTGSESIQRPSRPGSASRSIAGDSEDGEKRIRRSTRESKRPKFDDELVDSGITQKRRTSTDRLHNSPGSITGSATPASSSTEYKQEATVVQKKPHSARQRSSADSEVFSLSSSSRPENASTQDVVQESSTKHGLRKRNVMSLEDRQALEDALLEEEAARIEKKKRDPRIASKDMKSKELAAAQDEFVDAKAVEELKKWTVADDVALTAGVIHVCDLRAVLNNVRFSRNYTMADLEERWYQLLYDDTLAKLSRKRVQEELTPEAVLRIQSLTPYSMLEEEHLSSVSSSPLPDLQTMAELLKAHRLDFHSARTPQVLLDHWHLMNRLGVLGQGTNPKFAMPLDFDRIERSTETTGEFECEDMGVIKSISASEKAVHEWTSVSVQAVTGIVNDAQMPEDAIASLRGRVVRFLIKNEKVVLGRSTPRERADVNLALEGPALKISRKQAILQRDSAGEFTVTNIGKRAIGVDNLVLTTNQSSRLQDNAVLHIGLIRLVFHSQPIIQQT